LDAFLKSALVYIVALFGVFSVFSARERRGFWASLPSETFLAAIAADAITGTVLTYVGLPGWHFFLYALIACLVVNDVPMVELMNPSLDRGTIGTR
jgi:hypothetical protein